MAKLSQIKTRLTESKMKKLLKSKADNEERKTC